MWRGYSTFSIFPVGFKVYLATGGDEEDDPEEEQLFRDLWEDETQREIVVDCLKADCEVRTGRPPGL